MKPKNTLTQYRNIIKLLFENSIIYKETNKELEKRL